MGDRPECYRCGKTITGRIAARYYFGWAPDDPAVQTYCRDGCLKDVMDKPMLQFIQRRFGYYDWACFGNILAPQTFVVKGVPRTEIAPLTNCVELPWRNNEHDISCYPPGRYKVRVAAPSDHFPYRHLDIIGVPNRDGCKVHRANRADQLLGCCAVGESFKMIDDPKTPEYDPMPGVADSRCGLDEILAIMGDDEEAAWLVVNA